MKSLYIYILLLLISMSCVDPYDPPAISNAESYLVVEGFLNSNGKTTIKLSRTTLVFDEISFDPVENAILTVENDAEAIAFLSEEDEGIYSNPNLNLDFSKQYRLHISTQDGEEYYSEFVPVKEAPPIDEIVWEQNPEGVTVYLNTEDPQGNTRYYRWEYEETWEFDSYFKSELYYDNGEIKFRDETNMVQTCWQDDLSKKILIGTSVRLQEDVIYKFPLVNFPSGDWRLSKKYSILVKQYPMTKEGFEFYDLLKNNTEELGSFFDPQPGQTRGNFYSVTDPDKIVIGFLGAGNVREKRVYINNSELNDWIYSPGCEWFYVSADSIDFYFQTGQFIPFTYEPLMSGQVIYQGTTRICADCTVRGTTDKPPFWN